MGWARVTASCGWAADARTVATASRNASQPATSSSEVNWPAIDDVVASSTVEDDRTTSARPLVAVSCSHA